MVNTATAPASAAQHAAEVMKSGTLPAATAGTAALSVEEFTKAIEQAQKVFAKQPERWETFSDFIILPVSAGCQFLQERGLLDAAAVKYITGLVDKAGSNDSCKVTLMKDRMSIETANFLCERGQKSLGFVRAGSAVVRSSAPVTHHPHWSAEDPAYDSTAFEIQIGIVGK